MGKVTKNQKARRKVEREAHNNAVIPCAYCKQPFVRKTGLCIEGSYGSASETEICRECGKKHFKRQMGMV